MCRFTGEEISTMMTEVFTGLMKIRKENGTMIEAKDLTKYYGSGENRFQVLKISACRYRTEIMWSFWGLPVQENPRC